jgi:cation transport ATPase
MKIMVSSSRKLTVLSLIPGRVRLQLTGWTGEGEDWIENRLRRVNGVKKVQVNPLTGNALVYFDPQTTARKTLLEKLQDAWDDHLAEKYRGRSAAAKRSFKPRAQDGQAASRSLVHVGVRAILGHAVVDFAWFAAGLLGQSLGLPLAWLGPLHVVMDMGIWVIAFGSASASTTPNARAPLRRANCPAWISRGCE